MPRLEQSEASVFGGQAAGASGLQPDQSLFAEAPPVDIALLAKDTATAVAALAARVAALESIAPPGKLKKV